MPAPAPLKPDERAERALVAYVRDDMTLEQIGRRYGVCRERIRQDCNRVDRTLYALARRRRKARQRLASLSGGAGYHGVGQCATCGENFTRSMSSQKYCSPTHYQVAIMLRYHTDDRFWERHGRAVARWNLAHDHGSKVGAENVLDGTVERRGRWLVEGSVAFHWCLRAYSLEWPIFDRLHPQIRQQILDRGGILLA